MRRYFICFIIIIILISLSACAAGSVTISDTEYMTGFYPSWLWVKSESVETESTPIVSDSREFFRIKNSDLYISESISSKSGGDVWCPANSYDDAYAFYNDGTNYIFHAGTEYYIDDASPILIDHIDFEKFDLLAQGGDINSLNWQRAYKNKPDTLILSENDGSVCTLRAQSIDGLFVSIRLKLLIYNDALYYFIGTETDSGKYYYSPVPAEINEYFVSLLIPAMTAE